MQHLLFEKKMQRQHEGHIYEKLYFSPAKQIIEHKLKDEDNLERIKTILISFFGKFSHMYQDLKRSHDSVGIIPSTKGNNIPWITIEKRVKLHLLIILKAMSIGDSFINCSTYLGMIIQYLPKDCIIALEDDAKFNQIKLVYDDIERQASKFMQTHKDDDYYDNYDEDFDLMNNDNHYENHNEDENYYDDNDNEDEDENYYDNDNKDKNVSDDEDEGDKISLSDIDTYASFLT